MPRIQDVTDSIRAVGTIHAIEQAQLRPQTEGVVSEILFHDGAAVHKDEVLVRLDDRKARASLALAAASLDRAKAGLAVSQAKLARHKQLIREKLIAQETFEEAEAEYRSAEAEVRERKASLDLAQTQLDDYQIRAPFDGRMGAHLVDVGNFVEKATPLAYLVKTDPLEVEFGVSDRHVGRVNRGTQIDVSAASGVSAEGTVTFVDPRVDVNTRLLKLKAQIPNPRGTLKPGQFVEISIATSVRKAQVVVPEQAIVTADGKTWVFTVRDGKASRNQVVVGSRLPESVEIRSGLKPDVAVVVSGQHRLSDGADVEIIASGEGSETVGAGRRPAG